MFSTKKTFYVIRSEFRKPPGRDIPTYLATPLGPLLSKPSQPSRSTRWTNHCLPIARIISVGRKQR